MKFIFIKTSIVIINQMIRFCSMFLFLIQVTLNSSPIISDYSAYLQKWKEIAAPKSIINVTQMSNKQQMCNEAPCEFFYYLQENDQLLKDSNRNKTVLIAAGMVGNDYLAANTMLNLYGHIQAARIIYLPVANPSGFVKNTSNTYPKKIDIESDFPNARNSLQCYQSSAVNILEYIYSTYQIDLTILIEEGRPSFSYTSLVSLTGQQEYTQQESIYKYIFGLIKKQSSAFIEKEDKQSDKAASNFEIAEKSNNFIDWAYGASRFPQILKPNCSKKAISAQSSKRANGLAFALSIGKLEPNQQSDQEKLDSFMSRTINIFQQIEYVVNPRLNVNILKNETFEVQLLGCNSANLTTIEVINNENVNELWSSGLEIGEDTGQSRQILDINVPGFSKNLPSDAIIKFTYTCDLKWQYLGPTVFSKLHSYSQQLQYNPETKKWGKLQQKLLKSEKKDETKVEAETKKQAGPNKITALKSQKDTAEKDKVNTTQSYENEFLPYQMIKDLLKAVLIGGLVIVTICYMINCFKVGLAVFSSFATRGRRYQQKFQEVQYVQTTEYDIPQQPNQQNQQLYR